MRWGIAAILVIALVRVAATHRVFSQTTDEPTHIAAGYDFVKNGKYGLDPSHPPLGRIVAALPSLVRGDAMAPGGNSADLGVSLLWAHGDYQHNLATARRGNLFFLAAGIIGVMCWARRRFSAGTAVVAGVIYSSLPPILAHAGLATTDMAVAGVFPLAIDAFEQWIEAESARDAWKRAAICGVVFGVGALSKFTFLLFVPVAIATILVCRPRLLPMLRNRSAVVLVAAACIVVWAGYRFQFGTCAAADPSGDFSNATGPPAPLRPAVRWISSHVPLPAPMFFIGLGWVAEHARHGHYGYLLGVTSTRGFWNYFPVLLFYKTPLAFLALALLGMGRLLLRRTHIDLAVLPIAMLLAVMPSSINIGLRHILPIYAPMSLLGAHAVVWLWRESRFWFSRASIAAIAIAAVAPSVVAHPDYLSWYNVAAGGHGEQIAVDSNFDWGQDSMRLVRVAERRHIDHLAARYSGTLDLSRYQISVTPLEAHVPTRGWVVVGETALALTPGGLDWLRPYKPWQRVGTLRLYWIPDCDEISARDQDREAKRDEQP